jgi:hypothetical protein
MILAVTMIGLSACCAHKDEKPMPSKAATGYKK